MTLISKDNRNWASTEEFFHGKFQKLKEFMNSIGFDLVYRPIDRCIYGYWRGSKHNIKTIVFCIYLDKQDHVFKIEWVNDINGSYKYDSKIKDILK